MGFTVIEGCKREKPDYAPIYLRALKRIAQEKLEDDRTRLKRFIFYSVKYLSACRPLSVGEEMGTLMMHTNTCIGVLTPREIMTMFPVDKTYDGKKYETKDYYSTMEFLNEWGMDKPIGENIIDFLWDYMNKDLRMYCIAIINLMEESNKRQGKPSQAREFLQTMGIPAYTMFKVGDKEYLMNKATGEIKRAHKSRPRYLRPVPPYKK